MNAEFMEALSALAVEKGISTDTLLAALADALESAYKRMPGAHEYAWVIVDPDSGDIRVFAQQLNEDGEPIGDEFDVTPNDFGRIAAQTFRQVMMQRIREAERAQVRGVRGPRRRHRHRHDPAERRPVHAARSRPRRGVAAPG
jgi:N utilization substance protein A